MYWYVLLAQHYRSPHLSFSKHKSNHLIYPPASSTATTSASHPTTTAQNSSDSTPTYSRDATRFHLSSPPYKNYFYSNRHSSSHIVVTSPLLNSNLTIIEAQLLVAQPAGNSGVVAFSKPENRSMNLSAYSWRTPPPQAALQALFISQEILTLIILVLEFQALLILTLQRPHQPCRFQEASKLSETPPKGHTRCDSIFNNIRKRGFTQQNFS